LRIECRTFFSNSRLTAAGIPIPLTTRLENNHFMANLQVLLTESVPNLGAEADVVKVRAGYARNFLIPRGKGLELNPSALRRVDHLKAKRAEREAREVTAAEELASKIGKLNLSFQLETGESGKAFGSVTAKDIHDKLLEVMPGLELPRHAVELEKAIKETGTQDVQVRLHPDVTAKLSVKISSANPPADTDSESDDKRRPRRKTSE
jgi:large subunit ribosomal protein L9